MLYQLGDSKENFRAEMATTLGPGPNDKTSKSSVRMKSVLAIPNASGGDEGLPPDPDIAISVASDAQLALTAGAFPPGKGNVASTLRSWDFPSPSRVGNKGSPPESSTSVSLMPTPARPQPSTNFTSPSKPPAGRIRKLPVQETAPFSGEFEVVIPTAGAQAIAFASESAPGRDPNMAVSAQDYPGWQGKVGDKGAARIFGVDLNDNVAVAKMTVQMENAQALTHFILQTSMNGKAWTSRARYPEDTAPWDGRPVVTSFPTYRGDFPVRLGRFGAAGGLVPKNGSIVLLPSCGYMAAYVPNLDEE